MQMWQYIYKVIVSVKDNGNTVTRHEKSLIFEYLTLIKQN